MTGYTEVGDQSDLSFRFADDSLSDRTDLRIVTAVASSGSSELYPFISGWDEC